MSYTITFSDVILVTLKIKGFLVPLVRSSLKFYGQTTVYRELKGASFLFLLVIPNSSKLRVRDWSTTPIRLLLMMAAI